MGLLNLGGEEMVRVSTWWVTAPGSKLPTGEEIPTVRQELESLPLVQPLVPLFVEAHLGLQNLSRAETALPPAVVELTQKIKALDPRHDSLCRFVSHFIDLVLELIEDPEERTRLLALQRKLFPYGLSVINWTPSREAGAALRMEGRLSAEDRDLLRTLEISYKGLVPTNALAAVLELIEKGKQLGVLEDQKTLLLRELEAPQLESERSRKNRWMSLVTALRQMLKLEGVSAEVEQRILGPLWAAEAAADARAAASPRATPTPEEQAPEEKVVD